MTTAPEPLEDLERFDSDMKRWAARVVRSIRRRAEAGMLPQLSPDLPGEEWRPVVGAPDYQVSSRGRARFMGAMSPRFRPGQDLKPSPNGRGYLMVSIRSRPRLLHQLVAAAWHGPRAEGMVTRHLDGNPVHNTPENLAYGSQAQNIQDAQRHGTVRVSQHGSVGKYYTAGCRCDACRDAMREYQRTRMKDPKRRAADRARHATPEYRAADRARYAAKRAAQQKEPTE